MKNKQVTTKKRKKKRLNYKGVLFFAFLIVILFITYKSLNKINIKSVDVVGNRYISDGQIIKLASLNKDTSYFSFKSKDICKRLKTNDLIGSCKVKRKLDFKILITITENEPLFYYTSDNALVLSNGKKIGNEVSYPVPTLINYTPEEVLNDFISGLSNLKSDIIQSIAEIEYSPSKNNRGSYYDETRFMLEMNDGNIVYVNNQNLGSLDNYPKIYASIGDVKGYYNFDSERIKYDNNESYKNYLFNPFETSEEE